MEKLHERYNLPHHRRHGGMGWILGGSGMTTKHTPGPWKWQGEDYRGGWGWQMLTGPSGEGLIVGEGHDGRPYSELRAHEPLSADLCITGMAAEGKPSANAVHVFGEANARLIAAAPEMLEALKKISGIADVANGERQMTGRERQEIARAAIAKAEGRS